MIDQNTPIAEVQRLAKQGDKDALFEMIWRLELLPPEHQNDPVERCAWQDYWFEKAADAGHIDAMLRYAQSLINRIMNEEDRKKAMMYLHLLSDDYDAGKLNEEQKLDGKIAKMWFGVMLCEGYYTPRDAKRGAALIQTAHALTNGFEKFGFKSLSTIGEIYATGLAQEGEEPNIADLGKAINYLKLAISRFTPENDPNNRGFKQNSEDLLNVCVERKENKEKYLKTQMEVKAIAGDFSLTVEDTTFAGAAERRRKMMEVSNAARLRLEADKAAIARLRKRLAQEGW